MELFIRFAIAGFNSTGLCDLFGICKAYTCFLIMDTLFRIFLFLRSSISHDRIIMNMFFTSIEKFLFVGGVPTLSQLYFHIIKVLFLAGRAGIIVIGVGSILVNRDKMICF